MFANRVLVVCGVLAFACAPTRAEPELAPAPRPVPKKYAIHFEKVEWTEVLDWYAKETGLTLITTVKPKGTVSIKPGKERKFTIGEVTDLINEVMIQQKFVLIRRHLTFFIQPADEMVDPKSVPRVTIDELGEYSNSEIVQVVLLVEGIVVDDDVVAELKKLLTPFGTMIALKDNRLLIVDTAGNVRRIQKTLEPWDKKPEKR